jgi:hypothetical protein
MNGCRLAFMDLFRDYAFVVSGKKRKEVVKLLAYPRTPTELAKLLGVHANVSWFSGKWSNAVFS